MLMDGFSRQVTRFCLCGQNCVTWHENPSGGGRGGSSSKLAAVRPHSRTCRTAPHRHISLIYQDASVCTSPTQLYLSLLAAAEVYSALPSLCGRLGCFGCDFPRFPLVKTGSLSPLLRREVQFNRRLLDRSVTPSSLPPRTSRKEVPLGIVKAVACLSVCQSSSPPSEHWWWLYESFLSSFSSHRAKTGQSATSLTPRAGMPGARILHTHTFCNKGVLSSVVLESGTRMAVKPGCFAIRRDQNLSPNQQLFEGATHETT